MTTMLITSLLVAVLFVGIVTWKHGGLPDSISALVHALPSGRWRWLWSAWLAVVTLLMAPSLTTAVAGEWWKPLLADATVISLSMTAALPLLPGSHNRWHNALGIASGVLSQVCVWFVCPWWLLLWLVMAAIAADAWNIADEPAIRRWYQGKGVFIAESVCAATVYGSLLVLTETLYLP